jgi:rhodanese-related sulfurtransferase
VTLPAASPAQTCDLVTRGARIIDIRGSDEFARARLPGAENRPLETLTPLEGEGVTIFHCRSGARTAANAQRLAGCCPGEGYILEGGLEGWRKAGLPVIENRSAPIEIMRQVQIAAGLLVLAGVLLGLWVSPLGFGVAGFVGAGLTFAGVTGWCGMARLLAMLPWNRRAPA